MSALLLAVFVAIGLFAASALVIFMVLGERSPAETRLVELGVLPGNDAKVPLKYRVGDLLSLISTPLSPLRNWLRSNDEELAYRLTIAGYRRPEDVETYLSTKLLAPVVGVLLATFTGAENLLIFGMVLAGLGFFAPDLFLLYAINKRKTNLEHGTAGCHGPACDLHGSRLGDGPGCAAGGRRNRTCLSGVE